MPYDIDFDSGVDYPGQSLVELARVAEENGFGAVWKGESNSADPLVCLSAMATGTRTIGLGTGIYHVFGRSPVTLGIQAATLNDLSGGRLLLGLGVSNRTIAAWHGATFDRPLRRLREYAKTVRQAASGERVQGGGDTPRGTPFKLAWTPSYPDVPIYFAGLGEQMTRLAGRCADGVVVNMATPSMTEEIVSRVRQGAIDAGRDPTQLDYIVKVRVCLHHDREVATTRLKHTLTFYSIADHYRDLIDRMGFAEDSARIRETYRQHGFRAAQAVVPNTMVDGLPTIAAQSVDEVRDRLQPYLQAGATRLVIPYVPATEDAVGETRAFLEAWSR